MNKATAIVKLMATARALEKGDLYPEGAEADFSHILSEYHKAESQKSAIPIVSESFLTNVIAVSKQLLSEFDDESVLLHTPIAYHRKFERLRELIESAEEYSR